MNPGESFNEGSMKEAFSVSRDTCPLSMGTFLAPGLVGSHITIMMKLTLPRNGNKRGTVSVVTTASCCRLLPFSAHFTDGTTEAQQGQRYTAKWQS